MNAILDIGTEMVKYSPVTQKQQQFASTTPANTPQMHRKCERYISLVYTFKIRILYNFIQNTFQIVNLLEMYSKYNF